MAHPKTGNKYKVYPTYDFACPIVDSCEGVTHALRTTEYEDRDEQFAWFIKALGLRDVNIVSYARLNMMNTVLSKRKLTYFVEQGIVEGWDDPRMPTVRGIIRRGLTIDGLKQFIIAQGSSRSVVYMDWDKLWSFNRKILDANCTRLMAIEAANHVVLNLNCPDDIVQIAAHPKRTDLPMLNVSIGPKILIEQFDAQQIKKGDKVTLMGWGNIMVQDVNKASNGQVISIDGQLLLEDKDFKKTLKISWLKADTSVVAKFIYYEHLILKPCLDKGDDFKDFINKESVKQVDFLVSDTFLREQKKGKAFQFLKRGYFIVDEEYDEKTIAHVGKPQPAVLISIPDGTTDLNIFPQDVIEWKKKIRDESAKLVQDISKGKSKKSTEVKNSVENNQAQQIDYGTIDASSELGRVVQGIQIIGNNIRMLKSANVDKKIIQENVKLLQIMKDSFKTLTGKEYVPPPQPVVEKKPQLNASAKDSGSNSGEAGDINQLINEIKSVGDKIRQLKADKADKKIVQENVQVLLDLKAKFKALTGKEYVPGAQPAVGQKPQSNNPIKGAGDNSDKENEIAQLNHGIKTVGDNIRQLKADKVDKKIIQENVQILLDLKAKYKEITGTEWVPQPANQTPQTKPNTSNQTSKPKQAKDTKKSPAKDTPKEEKVGVKKQTRLGIESKKDENLADWYTEVITKSEMIEYYDVSGCYILRPWAYSIWEMIQKFLDNGIKSLGVENVYFPMFVSQAALEKEKAHIEDFAPEVAWVTKSGQSDLAEPIAIRPTSETVIYPSFAKWCQSHRSLPIKVNQWCNIVRWEFKNPTPFLRTREFLWQEGHTAHADKEDAVKEVYQVLDLYTAVYEHLLAIPVIKGRKTEKEKFAGGDFTTTIEGYIPSNGRGIQAATSHHLGQNFSKMFEIIFEDPNEPGKKCYAYQNSWGLTTRTIGVMIMVHSDDKGLVLPPNIAPYQVVIVPCGITATTTDEEKTKLYEECNKLAASLTSAEIRCKCDLNDHYSPGWKFNHWELKGVPIRIELGPKDLSKKQFVAARRDTGNKVTYNLDSSVDSIKKLLTTIHDNLFNIAKKSRDDHLSVVYDWNDFLTKLDQKYFLVAPFCGEPACEELIKKNSVKVDQSDSSGQIGRAHV